MSKRKVVVTGLGLVTPLGLEVAENWHKALAGASAWSARYERGAQRSDGEAERWVRVYQGIDLVDLGKFKEVFSTSDGLVREVFTEREMEDWRASPSWLNLAGCFAAKEACFKAMGMGLSGSGIDHLFQEAELLGGSTKHPELAVHGWLGTLMRRRRIDRWRVSVARRRGAALAAVVLIGQAAVENSI